MANLFETLVEVVGSEDVAKKVQEAVGQYMIPKTEYAKKSDALKAASDELEKIKLANMDSEQLLQHKLSEAEAIRKDFEKRTNRLEAERLLVQAGLSADVYSGLLDHSVSDDREGTIALVNGFVNVLAKEKEVAINKAKEELINSTKKPDANQATTTAKPPITDKRTF